MLFFAVELCLTAICAALAYTHPMLGDRWFSRLEQRFSAFAQKRARAVVLTGLLALLVRLAFLPVLPVPLPATHDDYSHLLLADTLAHGRLANPTHPMWVHFETFHVNWRPKYASMYYPGFALFLAFGQVFLGHPFWGVWLSSGLMCGAMCWALQGWLQPGWALAGALVALIRLGTFSYWVDSYWGGTVTALGGALVVGALPRIKKSFAVRDSVLMATGMGLLASTRPYEGLFFCLPVLGSLIAWAKSRQAPSLNTCLRRVALPVVLAAAVTLVALGYYFWRVTGSPLTIPYQLNMRTYGLVYFPWQKIYPIEFHHSMMHEMYRGQWITDLYQSARHASLRLQFLKLLTIWLFYFGAVLSLPVLVWLIARGPRVAKECSPEFRFLFLLSLVTYASMALTIYVGQPHYAAALTTVFYLMLMIILRDLWMWAPAGRPSGKFLARSMALTCALLCAAVAATSLVNQKYTVSWVRTWCSRDAENLRRASIERQLQGAPGRHLVLVRYQPKHDFILDEWVFNGADIDGSKVLWARDMGEAKNVELLEYFRDRQVWLVEPDESSSTLKPYKDGAAPQKLTLARTKANEP